MKVISQLHKGRKELTQKTSLEQLLQKQQPEKEHSKLISLFLVAYSFQDGYRQSEKIKERPESISIGQVSYSVTRDRMSYFFCKRMAMLLLFFFAFRKKALKLT